MDTPVHAEQFLGLDGNGSITVPAAVRDGPYAHLYSKLAASQELRKMLSIGRADDRNDLSRLSDAELIQQLTDQAKQLGVEVNLKYSFLQQRKPEDERQG